jgi:hypothetical protein
MENDLCGSAGLAREHAAGAFRGHIHHGEQVLVEKLVEPSQQWASRASLLDWQDQARVHVGCVSLNWHYDACSAPLPTPLFRENAPPIKHCRFRIVSELTTRL